MASCSVIIPAINEAAGIVAAVRSALSAGSAETIVVDGGSQDATVQLARDAGATVVRSAAGRALQQNAGASAASGDVLVFLHADNRLDVSALMQVSERIEAERHRGWGAMQQRIVDPRLPFRWLERGNAWRVRLRGLPFGDQAMFVRREWFRTAGGFPEVPLMEDLMLSQVLRKRSWPLLVRGPVYVDARRWNHRGIWQQTWLNWRLQWRYYRGADPRDLAIQYRRHDE